MSVARVKFLERLAGIRVASQDNLLLGASANAAEQQAARLLRNGLSVTAFAVLEGFVKERTGEVATWLTQQTLPFSTYPTGLQHAVQDRGLLVLAALQRREPAGAEFKRTLIELGASWATSGGGGAWTFPHAALLWPASNLKAGEAISILNSFGVADKWAHLTKTAEEAGFNVRPTDTLFNEIAARRNASAHDSAYDADVLLLRSVPNHLLAFAYAFDALLSVGAKSIRAQAAVTAGASCVNLTRFDQSASNPQQWDEYRGSVLNTSVLQAATHTAADEQQLLVHLSPQYSSPRDVLCLRAWDGLEHQVTTWATPGGP